MAKEEINFPGALHSATARWCRFADHFGRALEHESKVGSGDQEQKNHSAMSIVVCRGGVIGTRGRVLDLGPFGRRKCTDIQ